MFDEMYEDLIILIKGKAESIKSICQVIYDLDSNPDAVLTLGDTVWKASTAPTSSINPLGKTTDNTVLLIHVETEVLDAKKVVEPFKSVPDALVLGWVYDNREGHHEKHGNLAEFERYVDLTVDSDGFLCPTIKEPLQPTNIMELSREMNPA